MHLCSPNIPVPKMKTSQSVRNSCLPFILIFSEVPLASASQENADVSPTDILLLNDPHFFPLF